MSDFFKHPVLVNPTWPWAGDDAYRLDSRAFLGRVAANPGNMVFLYALTQQVEGLKHHKDKAYQGYDSAVWGCSNFIHAKRAMPANHGIFEIFEAPYVAIGLGAQAPDYDYSFDVPKNTKGWIEQIIDRAPCKHPNITVRGPYTQKILSKYGYDKHSLVLGCPSLFINPSTQLGSLLSAKFARAPEKVAVAPGNIVIAQRAHHKIEHSLAMIADTYGGGYICQGPEEAVEMTRSEYDIVDSSIITNVNKIVRPDLRAGPFRVWFRRNALVFGTVPSWMEYLRTCDLVIGTRIHGTVLALQSGTPALCIALDARQRELCETMAIPWVWWESVKGGITVDKARAILAEIDWNDFDRNRKQLAGHYIEFLRNNRFKPSKALEDIANS